MRLEDYFETREKFYICLEMHSQLTLHQYIRIQEERGDSITENLAQKHSQKLAIAIDYLHDHGIILRNFSALGILMTDPGEDGSFN